MLLLVEIFLVQQVDRADRLAVIDDRNVDRRIEAKASDQFVVNKRSFDRLAVATEKGLLAA